MDTLKDVLVFSLQFGAGVGAWFFVWLVTGYAKKRWALPAYIANAGRTFLLVALAALAMLLPDGGRAPFASLLITFMALFMAAETLGSYRRHKAWKRYDEISGI
jgi:hypothetical protein